MSIGFSSEVFSSGFVIIPRPVLRFHRVFLGANLRTYIAFSKFAIPGNTGLNIFVAGTSRTTIKEKERNK